MTVPYIIKYYLNCLPFLSPQAHTGPTSGDEIEVAANPSRAKSSVAYVNPAEYISYELSPAAVLTSFKWLVSRPSSTPISTGYTTSTWFSSACFPIATHPQL